MPRICCQPVNRPLFSLLRSAGVAAMMLCSGTFATAEWLALCSKCASPTVFSLTGPDTANAVAQARMTREEIQGWCDNWQPGNPTCVKQGLLEHDLNKVYRASADCKAGRIAAVDGSTYQLAGVWDNRDIGVGRSKWRDAQGKIVGRDNASGGLGISQQWEVLCPQTGRQAKATPTPAARAAPAQSAPTAPTAPTATSATSARAPEFAAGQVVMAKYGSQWIRAKVNAVRQIKGRNGPEVAYDVSLVNGQRGIVPARMLRAM